MGQVSLTNPALEGEDKRLHSFPQEIICRTSQGELIMRRDKTSSWEYKILLNEKELVLCHRSERILGLRAYCETEEGNLLVWPKIGNPTNGIEFVAFNREEAEILSITW